MKKKEVEDNGGATFPFGPSHKKWLVEKGGPSPPFNYIYLDSKMTSRSFREVVTEVPKFPFLGLAVASCGFLFVRVCCQERFMAS